MAATRPATECLGDELVYEFVHGRLPERELRAVEAHLNRCADCRGVVAETAKYLADFDADSQIETAERQRARAGTAVTALAPGTRIGRYTITAVTGSGGMGIVYAAHDPGLERKVALKLLRPELSVRRTTAEAQARLLREARAMAQVAHPNIVAVYEIGTFDDQVFLAMEFVEGTTLTRWLRAERRAWPQVLEVFAMAGRGLAAAHASGLVHRDFKPENVLIGNDGRVRVTDFGLARPALDPSSESSSDAAPAWYATGALTQTGHLAGTPAYMAPEQFRGGGTDPRTDQFSFCVALYEGLYGVRPFPADMLQHLVDQVLSGAVGEPPAGSSVPDWLRAAVLRGLRVVADERYPSMHELLGALSPTAAAPRPRRRAGTTIVVVALATATAVLGASVVAGWWRAPAAPAAPAPAPPPAAITTTQVTAPEPSPTVPDRPPPPVRAEKRHVNKKPARRSRTHEPAARAVQPAPPPPPPRHETSDDDLLP